MDHTPKLDANRTEPMSPGLLVLVRHGQSVFNLENRFTGHDDVPLTQHGLDQARAAADRLKALGLSFDVAYVSALQRAGATLDAILDELGSPAIERHRDAALNERDYGELDGMNKDEAAKRWGEAQVHQWRRSYTERPPGGESLRETGARVWPYYLTRVLPDVLRGNRVLVVAHGNSLRALMKVLDNVSDDDVSALELPTATPIVYRLNADSTVRDKQISSDSPPPPPSDVGKTAQPPAVPR